MENTIATSTPSQGQKLKAGLWQFFVFEIGIAVVTLFAGLFLPPFEVGESFAKGLPSVTVINVAGMLIAIWQSAVRFGVWWVYRTAYRYYVVKNTISTSSLHEHVSQDNSTDSSAWQLFGGYVMLGIILGLKVPMTHLWGFLFFAPLRVLYGSLLAYIFSSWLVKRETTANSIEEFCRQIGLPHVHGAAILNVTGMILGGLFA